MSIGRICRRTTYLADPKETVRAAAERMAKENVGALVVVDAKKKPVGIVTDRDLALRVVAKGLDSARATVGDVMTSHPRWTSECTPIEDAVATMRTLGVRRLPVVDAKERLIGIVSVDDVLELVTEELTNLGRIVAWSRPGAVVPAREPAAKKAPAAKKQRAKAKAGAGLERASPDLEC